MASSFKKFKCKIRFLTDTDMLFMVKKGIRVGICHAIYWYAKANNKCIKDYDENRESLYFMYRDVNNLYGWAMPQYLPVDDFEWVEKTFQSNKDFIKL